MSDLMHEIDSDSQDQQYSDVVTSDEEFIQDDQQEDFFSGITKGRMVNLERKDKIIKNTIENMKPDEEDQSKVKKTSVLQKIEKKILKKEKRLGKNKKIEEEQEQEEQQEEVVESESSEDDEQMKVEVNKDEEKKKKFNELGLIKPLLKAVEDMEFKTPTRIQELCIPAIMSGHDILARSITGSGKTGAFLLPIMQKLYLEKGTFQNYIRTLIIIPTRELAMQCYEMFLQFNAYTKLKGCLVIGAANLRKQEQELRLQPDLVIATPGRILDLVKNSQNIDLDNIDLLVFDEADKLFELGFEVEILELSRSVSPQRQTLLFSATLSQQMQQFTSLALKKPLKFSADPDRTTSQKLRQEVFKIEQNHFGDLQFREAALIYLLTEVFTHKVIIFFKTKKQCHRMMIIMGLLGLKAAELHGDLSQTDRINAFQQFKQGAYEFMLATDLAARGLDIKEIQCVINFELPIEINRYIHRIGRTARAGKSGVSITLSDENELKKLKKIMKGHKDKLFKRKYKEKIIQSYQNQIQNIETDYFDILKAENSEKLLEKAEQEVKRAENLIKYQDEIYNRPKRTWIMSKQQKQDLGEKEKDLLGISNKKDKEQKKDNQNKQKKVKK